MRRVVFTAVAAAGLLLPAAAATASPAPSSSAVDGPAQAAAVRVCPAPPSGSASCFALRNDAAPNATGSTPSGYGPSDIEAAYGLAGTAATGRTVAIVDAYDDPTAFNDVNVYRSQYGKPVLNSCSVSTTSGFSGTTPCFAKVNQSGGTTPPRKDGGWAQEISLDLDMVSAACPSCNILLVEASSSSFANLGAAENFAASVPGVASISNSYGGSDTSDSSYGKYYNHPGIAITVSSGDNGYGAEYPASSSYVTAVGGTSLYKSGTSYTESAWSGAGSGCSAYNTKPTWQTDTGCAMRTVADVSAVADPNTGVAVYDSTSYQGQSGWMVFGGTSASSPIVASVYALAGNTGAGTSPAIPASLAYSHASSLHDVTSGSNGTCSVSYLCNAGVGFDGPTGLGTPNGTGAF